jgi:hypothetical protein
MKKIFCLIFVMFVVSLSTYAADNASAAITVTVDAKTFESVQKGKAKVSIEDSARNAVSYSLKTLVRDLIWKDRFAEALFVGESYCINVVDAGMNTEQIRIGLKALEAEWREQDRADMAMFRLARSGNSIERQKALDAAYRLICHMTMRNHIASMLPDEEPPAAIIVLPKKKAK